MQEEEQSDPTMIAVVSGAGNVSGLSLRIVNCPDPSSSSQTCAEKWLQALTSHLAAARSLAWLDQVMLTDCQGVSHSPTISMVSDADHALELCRSRAVYTFTSKFDHSRISASPPHSVSVNARQGLGVYRCPRPWCQVWQYSIAVYTVASV